MYKVPCKKTMGMGDSCSEGWLCGACVEVTRLNAIIAAAPVQPVGVLDGEEFGFKAVRLRRTAFLLGLEGAIPDNDKDLMDCMGAVLGMICREVERLAAPAAPLSLPRWHHEQTS